MEDVKNWYNSKIAEETIASLKANNMNGIYVQTKEEALQKVIELLPEGAVIGMGGSLTISQIGLLDYLTANSDKYKLYNQYAKDLTPEEGLQIRKKSLTADVFLTGTNAITTEGELVNIDGFGNRVAGMIFGPEKVIVVAGVNKIVTNIKAALDRIKNRTAPMNSYRLNRETPCAKTARCDEASCSQSICNITTVIHKQANKNRMTVVLIGEELGF